MTRPTFACRSCGQSRLTSVLDLGTTPLANALLDAEQLDQPEPRYPLELVFCRDCCLVQITETVPPEQLFSEYLYFSSYSQTMLRHAEALAAETVAQRQLGGDDLVVEVASNDGYLLGPYQRLGVKVLGIEPARNIAEVAREAGIETLCAFFNADLAEQLADQDRRASVIHAHNVLAHIPDLNGAVEGIARLLRADGAAIIEVPYVVDMIDHCEFDTIYHEHLCYFSLHALSALFERWGLCVSGVRRVPIHGGSLQLRVEHEARVGSVDPAVAELLETERACGVDEPTFYVDFGQRVEALRGELTDLIAQLKADGRSIAVYGASAKGSTLLNYFGLDGRSLDFVVDRSPHKQGRFTPGTHLPILGPEALAGRMPDYTLLLTWNFRDEILAQQQAYRDRGGRFIVPIPRLEVI